MICLGLDLTDPYARRPRSNDLALLDETGLCRFGHLDWAEGDTSAWLAPFTRGPSSGDILVIDGPLAIAAPGQPMRACERLLGAAGKTPHELPAPGSRPFAGFVRGSVELASRLIAVGWLPLKEGGSTGEATLFEAYPGATWRRMAGREERLPKKATQAGMRRREALLVVRGLKFQEAPTTHDQLDAALCAWLGWTLRRDPRAVRHVGKPTLEENGSYQEGVILDVAEQEPRPV